MKVQSRHTDGQQVREHMPHVTNHQGDADQSHREHHTCSHGYEREMNAGENVGTGGPGALSMRPLWPIVWTFVKELEQNYHATQQFHFRAFIRRKQKH